MEWKLEDMKLMNNSGYYVGKTKIYDCESISKDEKIEFLDKMYDGKISKMIKLVEKLNQEKDDLPKDHCGSVKTVSLKAWIKRNDKYKLLKDYILGEFYIGGRRILSFNRKAYYEYHDDAIDQIFHDKLKELEREERKYFNSTDEYSVLKSKLRKKVDEACVFDLNLTFCSDGTISIRKEDDWDIKRDITIDEIKSILLQYEKLETFIQTLDINLKY